MCSLLTRQGQEVLLAHALKGHPSTTVLLNVIEASDWTVKEFSEIWSVIQSYWATYHSLPSKSEVLEAVSGDALRVAIGLYAFSDYESVALLVDKALNFVKARRLKLVVNSAMSSLDTDPLYTEHVLREGLMNLPTINCSVSSLDDLLPDAIYNYEDNIFGLPTGLEVLDRNLKGGVGLGEIFVVSGPSASGKSTLLSYICGSVARIVPSLYLTLELPEARVAQLLTARMGRIPQNELTSNLSGERFVSVRQRIKAHMPVRIKYFPSKTVTVSQIGGMLDYLRYVENLHIKALFLDYADLLTTAKISNNAPEWQRIATVYQELVDLGRIFDVAIFTASQLKNNDSIRTNVQEEIQQGDIAGSIEKVNKADVFIGWKPVESSESTTRGILSFVKVRNGATPPPYMISFDRNLMRIQVQHQFQSEDRAVMLGQQNTAILTGNPQPRQREPRRRGVIEPA